ncbi:MAG: DUF4157 domain-containing protein, partial [Angelakisella sp.]
FCPSFQKYYEYYDGGSTGKEDNAMYDNLIKEDRKKVSAPKSDVQVHYTSNKPQQVNASAYTQGNQVYLGKGQERYLSHELGHVLQQQQGKVPTTESINGISANTDTHLEHEADRLGESLSGKMNFSVSDAASHGDAGATPAASSAASSAAPIQMMRTPAQWWRDRQDKKMQSRRDNAQISAPLNKKQNRKLLQNSGVYGMGDLVSNELIALNMSMYNGNPWGPNPRSDYNSVMKSIYKR